MYLLMRERFQKLQPFITLNEHGKQKVQFFNNLEIYDSKEKEGQVVFEWTFTETLEFNQETNEVTIKDSKTEKTEESSTEIDMRCVCNFINFLWKLENQFDTMHDGVCIYMCGLFDL